VQVSFAWVPRLAGRALDVILRRQPAPAPAETIERLRTRKAEVGDQLEQLRASARFEPSPEAAAGPEAHEIVKLEPSGPPAAPKTAAPSLAGEQPAEEGYTARLLKAKKKVWEEKGMKDER